MEYLTLVIGILFTLVFVWLLVRNSKRSGFIHAWLRIETLAGVIAGTYLVISSFAAIIQ
ncbi:hypothetical protein WBG78_16050 [Chryseolinea sp. T2]|uniref:hypothetical protein n=1 Tax=Chryseolinea sp. T2 TaxID=3129255 RepID=UPI0030773C4E